MDFNFYYHSPPRRLWHFYSKCIALMLDIYVRHRNIMNWLGIYEPPPINDKLREGISEYWSPVWELSKYNRSLVDRIHSLLDINSLYKWKYSLEEENKCKRGRPFKVPDVLINPLAKIRSNHSLPFRSIELILRIFCLQKMSLLIDPV